MVFADTRIESCHLLLVHEVAYWARFVTGTAMYKTSTWSHEWTDDQVIITLRNARIRDSQGRGFVTEMLAARRSPRIAVPVATLVTVIGRKQAYHVPLPRACSLYLEKK